MPLSAGLATLFALVSGCIAVGAYVGEFLSPDPAFVFAARTATLTMAMGFACALAVICGSGFAGLDRFFASILERSAGRVAAQTAQPVDCGVLLGREYRLFADGSVELDTVFGGRRFATLSGALAFVGAIGETDRTRRSAA